MPTRLLLAPVGAGKTERALEQLIATTHSAPFARIWVLLASERQVSAFRRRLVEYQPETDVYFNVEFFTFPDLYARLLDMTGQPTQRLGEPARLRLVRNLAVQIIDELEVFQQIADKPGFARLLADVIYELKGNLIEPDVLRNAAEVAFGVRPRDAELVALYAEYQQRLRDHDIVDREGEGWLALAELDRNRDAAKDVALLLVDGYDQFTPLQAELLALMSARVGQTLITLTTVPEREQLVGRRFVVAQQTLTRAHNRWKVPLTVDLHTAPHADEQRHADLQHLADTIFRADAVSVASEGRVIFREVPSVAGETALVLQEVKRLLLGDGPSVPGARPDDVLIVLRDWEQYRVHFETLGHAYGLPLALHYGEPLAETPPVHALMSVLTLHDPTERPLPFPRRATIEALRTPYFAPDGLDNRAVGQLDRISRALVVLGGRDEWLRAIIQAPTVVLRDDEGEAER